MPGQHQPTQAVVNRLARTEGHLRASLAIALLVILVILVGQLAGALGPHTDLYGRWYGLRRLLFDRVNPYGATVTQEIAAQTTWFLAGRPGHTDAPTALETAFGFLYPLPGVLLLAPLAVLPYPTALTLWLMASLLCTPLAAWLAADTVAPPLAAGRPARLLALPLGLLFLPLFANLLHAQFTPVIALLLAAALWGSARSARSPESTTADSRLGAPDRGLSFWAGAALTTGAALKPQLFALLAPLWLGSQLWRWQRWRGRHPAERSRWFLLGAVATGLVLGGTATVLVPSWPSDFVHAATAYASLASTGDYPDVSRAVLPGGSTVWRLLQSLLPGGGAPIAAAGAVAGTAALIAWAIAGWRDQVSPAGVGLAAGRTDDGAELRGVTRTVVVSALVLPPAWEANAVLLLIPLGVLLGQLATRPRAAVALAIAAAGISALDLPMYITWPWHNGPLLIAAYTALVVLAGGLMAARCPLPRPG